MDDGLNGFILGVLVICATSFLGMAGVIDKQDIPLLLLAVLPGAAQVAQKRRKK